MPEELDEASDTGVEDANGEAPSLPRLTWWRLLWAAIVSHPDVCCTWVESSARGLLSFA
ncbi:hypothetical protein BDZ89DRAFT_1060969, partial [Hymenopellis radicata]